MASETPRRAAEKARRPRGEEEVEVEVMMSTLPLARRLPRRLGQRGASAGGPGRQTTRTRLEWFPLKFGYERGTTLTSSYTGGPEHTATSAAAPLRPPPRPTLASPLTGYSVAAASVASAPVLVHMKHLVPIYAERRYGGYAAAGRDGGRGTEKWEHERRAVVTCFLSVS
ncbi:hypothetical protein E2C01_065414 [Portunus trituberculatus]|uniref:Uncharacterized protein n=1 Tax=Portunus trituberculatus TaxID=210409 RepID=A0A5B7HNB4_PORTR|nr:hypothetical protein [Portunus trituberculatus]